MASKRPESSPPSCHLDRPPPWTGVLLYTSQPRLSVQPEKNLSGDVFPVSADKTPCYLLPLLSSAQAQRPRSNGHSPAKGTRTIRPLMVYVYTLLLSVPGTLQKCTLTFYLARRPATPPCVCVSAGVCACILCVYVSTVCVWCAAFGGRKLSPPVVTDHVLATECCTQCLYA